MSSEAELIRVYRQPIFILKPAPLPLIGLWLLAVGLSGGRPAFKRVGGTLSD